MLMHVMTKMKNLLRAGERLATATVTLTVTLNVTAYIHNTQTHRRIHTVGRTYSRLRHTYACTRM